MHHIVANTLKCQSSILVILGMCSGRYILMKPLSFQSLSFFFFTLLGNNEDIPFSRPADLDLIQSTPFKPLALKTPPRVLTLSERPLDFLDLERPPPTPQNEEVSTVLMSSEFEII